jgi:hypothetical protein
MELKKLPWVRFLPIIILVMLSCQLASPAPLPTPSPVPQSTPSEEDLAVTAQRVVFALQARDLDALAAFVHPEKGVRFSPYTFAREEDLVFMPDHFSDLLADQTVYEWGAYDGTGEPIHLTFAEYYDRFVYPFDYAAGAQISYSQPIGFGNTINNLAEFYAGARVVEFYQAGTDQYSGMDWSSLRLVFESTSEGWKLIAIVNDIWTI